MGTIRGPILLISKFHSCSQLPGLFNVKFLKLTEKRLFFSKMNESTGENVSKKEFSSDYSKENYFFSGEITGNEFFNNKTNCNDDNYEKLIIKQLKEALELRETNISSWIIETRLKTLCGDYKCLSGEHRKAFLITLASEYAVNHTDVHKAAEVLCNCAEQDRQIIKIEEKLKSILTPPYQWLFMHIGKLENGIKFLVDMRTDLLDNMKEMDATNDAMLNLQQLNSTLRDLLSLWFSVGFLKLERITWKSSCEMLQKISEYEAVHPVRSWTDLKRRVGPYRRCFVYTHSSMPDEPLVVLHTALSDVICSNVDAIMSNARRLSLVPGKNSAAVDIADIPENPKKLKAAIFYSITSTQQGLQGIELGNYLIKRVITEVVSEYPQINKFSSLSPIPGFRSWLFDKFKSCEKTNASIGEIFTADVLDRLKSLLKTDNVYLDLRKRLNNNGWLEFTELVETLESPLMKLCAQYLYKEKRRGYAFDAVANFHLRNGAVMWRINWLADLTPRGLTNSCGIMVNYRYFLDNTEANSRCYIEKQEITISPLVETLI